MSIFSDERWTTSNGNQWVGWPSSRGGSSAWSGHVPFAHWLVGAIHPNTIVELGTMQGVSYAAFCFAVKVLNLQTRCWSVDHWEGDPHAGKYGDTLYKSMSEFNDKHFAAFSKLLKKSFDEALTDFDDGLIDLLHIDGYHTYEAVKHDFETWRPKLSKSAVVLFHDVTERRSGFGAYRAWEEFSSQFPSFTFRHSHGLGVLAPAAQIPASIEFLFRLSDREADYTRDSFEHLGKISRIREVTKMSAQKKDNEYAFVDSDYSLLENVVIRVIRSSSGGDGKTSFVVIFDDPTAKYHCSVYATGLWRDAFGFANGLAAEKNLEVVIQIVDDKDWSPAWGKLTGFDSDC